MWSTKKLGSAVVAISLLPGSVCLAQAQRTESRPAISVLRQESAKVCDQPSLVGVSKTKTGEISGTVQAKNIIKHFADIGVTIRAKSDTAQYAGLLQKDFVEAFKIGAGCRERMFTMLFRSFYVPQKTSAIVIPASKPSASDFKLVVSGSYEDGFDPPPLLSVFVENTSPETRENILIKVEALGTIPLLSGPKRTAFLDYVNSGGGISSVCFTPVSNQQISYRYVGYNSDEDYDLKFRIDRLYPGQFFYFVALVSDKDADAKRLVRGNKILDRYMAPSEREEVMATDVITRNEAEANLSLVVTAEASLASGAIRKTAIYDKLPNQTAPWDTKIVTGADYQKKFFNEHRKQGMDVAYQDDGHGDVVFNLARSVAASCFFRA